MTPRRMTPRRITLRAAARRCRRPLETGTERDSGTISIFILGLVLISLTLVLGVLGATSVQLSRIQLLDAADAAALDASDQLDEETAYTSGITAGVPLTDAGVQQAAAQHLSQRERPARISEWHVAGGTGAVDGRTAVVRLQGQAQIPVLSAILSAFGGSVTITVESHARSDVE